MSSINVTRSRSSMVMLNAKPKQAMYILIIVLSALYKHAVYKDAVYKCAMYKHAVYKHTSVCILHRLTHVCYVQTHVVASGVHAT